MKTTRIGVLATAAALSIALVGCTSDDSSPDSSPDTGSDSGSTSSSDSSASSSPESTSDSSSGSSNTEKGADLATTTFAVSWEDALGTAQGNFDGDFRSLQLGWEGDQYAYTIKLLSDTQEYETKISADSGDVISDDTEDSDSDDNAEKAAETFDPHDMISWDDALSAAQDVRSGRVSEKKLEGTSDGPQYEFDFEDDGGGDTEVTIDAKTGDVISKGD